MSSIPRFGIVSKERVNRGKLNTHKAANEENVKTCNKNCFTQTFFIKMKDLAQCCDRDVLCEAFKIHSN